MVRVEDYEFYKKLDWPKGTQRDSMYAILFRAALSAIIDDVHKIDRWRFGIEPSLSVVLEKGHKNAGDALRFYRLVSDRLGGESKALAGLRLEDKATCLPLAAADLFAYSAYGREVGSRPIGTPAKPLKADSSYRGNAWRIVIDRDTLELLHQQTTSFAKERALARRRRTDG